MHLPTATSRPESAEQILAVALAWPGGHDVSHGEGRWLPLAGPGAG
jgi:hypothetical protein